MKLEMLARWNRDTADAVRWLRDNHDKFKMEVFEPPYMNVTVPDKSFVAAVESNFDTNAMQARSNLGSCVSCRSSFVD